MLACTNVGSIFHLNPTLLYDRECAQSTLFGRQHATPLSPLSIYQIPVCARNLFMSSYSPESQDGSSAAAHHNNVCCEKSHGQEMFLGRSATVLLHCLCRFLVVQNLQPFEFAFYDMRTLVLCNPTENLVCSCAQQSCRLE